jgi:hypothetical protein
VICPPTFTGGNASAAPQSLEIDGLTYTAGWKLAVTGKYSAVDASVYCKFVK